MKGKGDFMLGYKSIKTKRIEMAKYLRTKRTLNQLDGDFYDVLLDYYHTWDTDDIFEFTEYIKNKIVKRLGLEKHGSN